MAELLWQDPPARNSARGNDYTETIETLKAHPGRWALVLKEWKTSAAPAAFRQAGCQATTRQNKGKDQKTYSVYARYPAEPAKARADAGQARKSQVAQAVSNGTALKPPAKPGPKKQAPPAPANDMGLSKFLADRRARGAVNLPE